MIWLIRSSRLKQLALFSFAFLALNVLALRYFAQDIQYADLDNLQGHCIAIDAGHGGIDNGAARYGKLEKDINLAIAVKIKDILQEHGCLVVMTREDDSDYYQPGKGGKRHDLETRSNMINSSSADLFISIHVNAIRGDTVSSGAQVFYNPKLEENKILAQTMQKSLSMLQASNKRQIKEDLHIFMLKATTVPGVLVETGFISNEKEAMLLASDSYQQKLAESIAKALAYHVSQNVGR